LTKRARWWHGWRISAGRVLAEHCLVEHESRRPGATVDGREHRDFEVSGFSDLLQGPILSGWKRRRPANLQDQAADLDRVDIEIHDLPSVALKYDITDGSQVSGSNPGTLEGSDENFGS
jgi:hypothetical protein